MSQPNIHPTAIVDPQAKIGADTVVGPFAIIEGQVEIGSNCTIHPHAMVRSFTYISDEVSVYPYAIVGEVPQHLGYCGEESVVRIGRGSTIREYTSVHRGTKIGDMETTIGENVLVMGYCHIAHDCHIGDRVIMANQAQLAGHVSIGDDVVIGGQVGVAQFLRVGKGAYIGGGSVLRHDMPPFVLGKGIPLTVQGTNLIGLKKLGYHSDSIQALRKIHKLFYNKKITVAQAMEMATSQGDHPPEVNYFLDFVRESKSGISR